MNIKHMRLTLKLINRQSEYIATKKTNMDESMAYFGKTHGSISKENKAALNVANISV